MHPKRELCIKMRLCGKSYREIEIETGVQKSTLSYMLRHIELTKKQRIILDGRKIKSQIRFTNCKNRGGRNRLISARGGKNLWNNNRIVAEQSLKKATIASALSFLPHELILLPKLEALFEEHLRKEKIGGKFFDFVGDTVIIEHSYDGMKGVSLIIDRFSCILNDHRRKIAYVDTKFIGLKRKSRFRACCVEVRDYKELE